MIVEHADVSGHLETASDHLSYGERNAFALVLFMHHVRRDKPDLVVLDDPVSSFDKTKKFAILHQLFQGRSGLRGFTTLLLTHDIEPVIDVVQSATSRQFAGSQPVAHFLRSSSDVVTEKQIQKGDIVTFSNVCKANIEFSADNLIRCIYLRRWYEVHGDYGVEYDLLSSLLHLRQVPDRSSLNGQRVALGADEIASAVGAVAKWIPGFDYSSMVTQYRDGEFLSDCFHASVVGYEKVQICRIASQLIPEGMGTNAAFRKFVNESFHIENEYVMQLNPREFDAVPQYVIKACAKVMSEVSLAL